MTLFLHLARRAVVALLGAMTAVVLIFLVVDFAENAAAFQGAGWGWAVLQLYLNRAAVVVYQIAPAAMLLAAALTASDLRRTREYTALRSLGFGPWRVAFPVLAVAAVLALGLAWLHDTVVIDAAQRADEILVTRFHRASGLQRSLAPRRWFRSGDGHRIYHLRAGAPERGFERVTVLDVTESFHLVRRVDAARMTPGETRGEWVLEEVAERSFGPDGSVTLRTYPRRVYRFPEKPGAFDVRPGRPMQMNRKALGQQVTLRRRLGLPYRDFELERQHRLAYPLACLPAALVALALALRRNRKGHFSTALVESVGGSLVFWALQGAFWSLGLAGRLSPGVAAWAPDALFLVAGVAAIRR